MKLGGPNLNLLQQLALGLGLLTGKQSSGMKSPAAS